MKQDVRLLTLYKQHYMDEYKIQLKSEYSCWGYYDGMDIAEVNMDPDSKLLETYPSSPISDVWYKTGEKNAQITGQYSSQNIGLFRCMPDAESEDGEKTDSNLTLFWEERKTMLFFGVAFLQLDAFAQYQEFSKSIEGLTEEEGKKCRVLAYCTFDNADLVILIHGNSLHEIERRLQSIEEKSEVRYQHSVVGVSEQYLGDCEKQGEVLEHWGGNNCFIKDEVSRLDIRLASSGEAQVIGIEKKILDDIDKKYEIKNFSEAKYSYVVGHENIVISLKDTDVRTMLIFLLPKGFATHQNESYSKRKDKDTGQCQPRLYNIETTYMLESRDLKDVEGEEYASNVEVTGVSHNWFQEQIGKYKIKLEKAWNSGDESLYSYFLALLKTLNTLVQYERFGLSEDIFYLLYPSFKLFDEYLTIALDTAYTYIKTEPKEYYARLEQIKKSLCEYIESVNSVVYHTIHTDQVFLMIPGYSGTSFSIPIKLNMMFLWFTDCVVQLFGEDEKWNQCILVPTMESRPQTHKLQFGQSEKDFLVCIKMSQRTLSMPWALMIILAHEMGHYVGGALRCRKERAENLKKFTAQCLVDLVLPKNIAKNEKQKVVLSVLREEYRQEVQNKIQEQIQILKLEEKGYCGDDVKLMLQGVCRQALAECKIISEQSVIMLSAKLGDESDSVNGKIKEYLFQMNRLAEQAKDNAINGLICDYMLKKIHDELRVYREAFSDIIAMKLLECDVEDFVEAHYISEGIRGQDEEWKRREQAIRCLVNESFLSEKKEKEPDDYLYEYLLKCDQQLEKRLEGDASSMLLTDIRNLYHHFEKKENPDSAGFYEVYNAIVDCIQKMKSKINEEMSKKV